MLHAIAREEFDAAVIQLHRNIYRQFAVGIAQYFANALIEAQLIGGIVEAGFSRQPWIHFLIGSDGCRHTSILRRKLRHNEKRRWI